jgi:hypothetical protein
MRVLLRHAAISVLAGVISVFCLINALLQRDMAQGDKELSVANLIAADSYYSSASARLSYFGRIPWIFSDARAEILVNRAAIRYWQGDYAGLLADYPTLQSSMSNDDARLGLVFAGSVYRVGQHSDVTNSEMLNSLDQAIGVYAQVLEGEHQSYDAAFNYEYLIRLREALSGGAEWVPRGLEMFRSLCQCLSMNSICSMNLRWAVMRQSAEEDDFSLSCLSLALADSRNLCPDLVAGSLDTAGRHETVYREANHSNSRTLRSCGRPFFLALFGALFCPRRFVLSATAGPCNAHAPGGSGFHRVAGWIDIYAGH